ncbi:MAG: hypothetical protein DRN61_04100 [Thaumarchaeota archaeon]|nr:MAG: hypothetical protein DRN61_04100 [Nitrososphaerota archaeon]
MRKYNILQMMKSVVGNLSGEYAAILEKAIDEYELPWDAPVELHIVDEDGAREYLRQARKSVRIR